MTSHSVLLVDANILFRKGLAALLAESQEFLILGEYGLGFDVLSCKPGNIPDIFLMDIGTTGLAGLDVVTQIKRRMPQTRVVLLTWIRSQEYIKSALKAGVDGYLLKDASVEELHMALRSTVSGRRYISSDVSVNLLETFLNPEVAGTNNGRIESLSDRELRVLQLIAEGRSTRGVADILCVSARTVEKCRASLQEKLGLESAVEITLTAIAMGLVERPAAIARLMAKACDTGEAAPIPESLKQISRNQPIPIRNYLCPV